jgi:hypothetical protein
MATRNLLGWSTAQADHQIRTDGSAMRRPDLGKLQEAQTKYRAPLAAAAAVIGAKMPKLDSGNLGDQWNDWIMAHAVLNEAKVLIEDTAIGGGGGSIIDSSAITNLAEVSGIASPDDSTNCEIIITAVPSLPLAITIDAALGFTNGVFGFDVTGPSGSNVVIQASTDLQTWIPLQTNLLGSGLLYFSDAQSPASAHRFYRAQLLP